jgi:hypothetical protein
MEDGIMKTVTIIRNETVNGKKVEVGRKDFALPENCDELFDIATTDEGAAEVYNFWYAAKVIALRATIGGSGKSAELAVERTRHNLLIQKAREMKVAGDSTLYDNLVSLEIIRD